MATRQDGVPSHYPCMTQKDGIRRVHDPHGDPRPPVRPHRLRRSIARFVAAVRAQL